MSDFNNLDDIFDDDFDLEQEGSVTLDNIDQELLEDDDEEGLNRTFVFAGMSLFGTFAAIVAAVVLLAGGGEDTNALETAGAIETFNAQQFTQAAETVVAIENLSTQSAQETSAANANATSTAIAEAQETEDTRNTQVAATVTQIAVAATQTQFANQTAIAAELTANAPTVAPTVSIRFEIRDENGNPVQGGSVIQIFQDDGDREFDPVETPTTPPTTPPTVGPTPSPPDEAPVADETVEADDTDANPTAAALTLEAQISEFDRLATQRAEEAANTTDTPTPQPEAPADAADDEAETTNDAAPANDTAEDATDDSSVAETPVANDTSAIAGDTTTITAGSAGTFSIELPSAWIVEDNVDAEASEFRFADSQAFLDSISVEQPVAADVGTGGIISVLAGQQADAFTLDIVEGALLDSLAENQIEFVEPIADYDHPTIDLVRAGIIRGEGQQGYVAVMGSGDTLLLVLLSTSEENFPAQQDQLAAIIDSIEVPTSGVSFRPAPSQGQVFLMSYDPGPGFTGPQQGGPTPTPAGDEPGVPITIQPDGTGTITLPGEPGTYFLVLDFPPGSYTLFIEGQEIDFEVIQGQFTEAVVILADRTLIIRSFGLDPAEPTPTVETPTPTLDVPLQDTPISPFLQTATANARDVLPVVTATVVVTVTPTPDMIPQTGLFSEDGTATTEGLTMLALMGAGLLGIVFIVRRLRSTMSV